MKNIFLSLMLVLLSTLIVNAQKSDCLSDFDYLVEKIKNDYPGYNQKVNSTTKDELLSLELKIRKKLSSYPDSCFSCLEEYASFFKDRHLRVYPVAGNSTKQDQKVPGISTFGRNVSLNADSLFNASIDAGNIEGIWKGFSSEFAIVKKMDGNGYIGIVISAKDWKKDQVKYEFAAINETEYTVIEHTLSEAGQPVAGKASLLLSGKMLEIHNKTQFVRKSGPDANDQALLLSYSPVYPNLNKLYWLGTYMSDSTFYLKFPSFYSDKVDYLLEKHWSEIVSRPNLIIDIRNNGGGQDSYFKKLLTLIYTRPYISKGVEWYASEGIIQMIEEQLRQGQIQNGEAGITWAKTLLEEMKKNKGGFVVHPLMGKDEIIKQDTIYRYPKKIGIIINERNGSSAEQFLLSAKQSDKVILFGNKNTAGVLDYSNAIPVKFPSGRFQLTFPMTRSRRLPENHIDNVGIAPDILVPYPSNNELYDKLDSWAYFVKYYLEFKGN